MDERTNRALAAVDLSGTGLEIGPAYNPLLPKTSGRCIETVDHDSRDGLVAKYSSYGLPGELLDRIEDVDHVIDGGSLFEAVGAEGAYDFILASNVIEHSVDLIGLLQDCERLLRSNGRLSLIVPDKRYCFDLFKPLSSVGSIVDAHLRPTRYHPPGSLLDHTAYACTRDGEVAWHDDAAGHVALQFADVSLGAAQVADGLAQDAYHDTHRWRFTPAWFTLVVSDLRALGYHSLCEVATAPRLGFEFFVTLGRDDSLIPSTAERLVLMERTRLELAEPLVADLRATADALQTQAERLEVDLAAARHEVDTLRTSTSWKVTRPLRSISTRVGRLRGRP